MRRARRLSILYLGAMNGTCRDRSNALRRLGHSITHLDLREYLPKAFWVDRITWNFGGHWFSPVVLNGIKKTLGNANFDLCYVDAGEYVTPRVIVGLRKYAGTIIAFNVDDPFGTRDGARFAAYRLSVPFYDLCAVVRNQNVKEAYERGAQRVSRVFFGADEIKHSPREISADDVLRWQSDVLFLGTWFPERSSFLIDLLERGIPLTIRGSRWNKAREWADLKQYWRGGPIFDDDYAKAIQCAKVNLGLLSKGNRDLHTTRSMEIPALGGLLCAERTTEHVAMYREYEEALFWNDADECAVACQLALSSESLRRTIAQAGRARLRANGFYNEDILDKILEDIVDTNL